jgi:hypothetical protein
MKILILGNAKNRLEKKDEIKAWKEEIWVCNKAYNETILYKNISLVASVHQEDALNALEYKIKNNLSYDIMSNQVWKQGIKCFKQYRGWSTGTELIHEAILKNDYEEIWLSGFSFISYDTGDIYNEGVTYCNNFINQFNQIKDEFPSQKIIFL